MLNLFDVYISASNQRLKTIFTGKVIYGYTGSYNSLAAASCCVVHVLVKLVLAKRKIGTNACGVCERMLRIKLPKKGTTIQSTFALRDL